MDALGCIALTAVISALLAGLAVHFWRERQDEKKAKAQPKARPVWGFVSEVEELPLDTYAIDQTYVVVVGTQGYSSHYLIRSWDLPMSGKFKVEEHPLSHLITAIEEVPEARKSLGVSPE